ncbi:MAG: methyltransferase domain-containing protein [Ignavibacteriae bacterium]|nr:methyltransferase domain-containing protein [Ignavibacteriota bacterium]
MNDTLSLLRKPEFPRSNTYDPQWMLENQMGPNAVWLCEWLTEAMHLEPGMRLLDLGCGKALSSIFLAKEFGVRVWAADLWIAPDHNWRRATEAGLTDSVYPLRAEAHALPFPPDFFNAVVSIDAYQYFGTDLLYLQYLSRFVRAGGSIGVVVPGFMREITEVPAHLATPQSNGKVFWEDDLWSFRTAAQWRAIWERSAGVHSVRVDTLPDGWRHWSDFERALERSGKSVFPSDAEALEADAGQTIGFHRAVAIRADKAGMNLYDTSIGLTVGVDT